MTCYHPVSLKSTKRLGILKDALIVPCGICIGCLLRRARDWTVRCSHELSMHDDSMFITLTYEDPKLPMLYEGPHVTSLPSLFKPDLQKFFKRYRKYLVKKKFRSSPAANTEPKPLVLTITLLYSVTHLVISSHIPPVMVTLLIQVTHLLASGAMVMWLLDQLHRNQ